MLGVVKETGELELADFEGRKHCVKCFAEKADYTYIPPGAASRLNGDGITGECMVRTCKTCGFQWAERTFDA